MDPTLNEKSIDGFQAVVGFDPWLVAATLGCLGVATAGAVAANCLATYSPTKLENRVEDEEDAEFVEELEQRETHYRIIAQVCFLSGLISSLLLLRTAVDANALPWAIGGFGLLALLACGVVPAAIANGDAERSLLRLLPMLRLGLFVLRWPLVMPLQLISALVLRALRLREEPGNDPEEIAEDVMAAVADSTEDGLADEEKAWIGNIVGLKDLQVSTIMTPRPDLVAIRANTPLKAATQLAQEHGFSRYPVYREQLDEVIGIFYAKDALKLVADAESNAEAAVETMMRDSLFVPESMGVAQLLHRFQTSKMHVAIALDEYGNTAGVVSFEDVLEQIVGDIDDEFDEAESCGVTVVEAGRIIEVPGRTSVGDIEELLGLDLPNGDWETIAGFVIHHSNRIPSVGETLLIEGIEFSIVMADDRRIGRLRVTMPTTETASNDG